MTCQMKTVYFVVIVLLFRAIIVDANTASKENDVGVFFNQHHDQENSQNAESTFPQRKWISELFFEARMAFQMDPNVNTECKKSFDLFKLHLQNQSFWAVKMMASSEWPLNDILSGAVDYMGNYDDCLKISSYGIKGHYCLIDAIYDYPDTPMKNKIEDIPDGTISVWEALSIYQNNPAKMERKKLRFAMCIPSSCKPVDLMISLNNTLNPIFETHGLNISVDVNPILCKIREESIYPLGYYIVGWSFIALFLFVICCTFLDTVIFNEKETKMVDKPKEYLLNDICECFSITRNFQKLKHFDPKDKPGLYILKLGNMVAMISAHRAYYLGSFPLSNAIITELYHANSGLLWIHTNCVADPFFMVSGFLKFHLDLLPMSERGLFFLFSSIILRWIRMVPVYCGLMLFITYVLPYIGDGPIWDYTIANEVTHCKESWWTSLLAINNIVKSNKMCLVIGWYIAVDIQLSIIGGILVYIFSKNKKIGTFASLLSFLLFTIMTFIIGYVNEYNGIMRLFINVVKADFRSSKDFTNFYIATYTRCGPYLIGFFSAYVAKMLNDRNFKFTEMQASVIFLVSLLVTEMSAFYGIRFYDFNRQFNRFENALYAAVICSLFVVVFAVSTILYYTSGLGKFQSLIEANIWIPLGRLTYSVFLINTLLMLYHAASQKNPMVLSNEMAGYWLVFGDILFSYTIALFLHLFVEAPILRLKTIFHRQILEKIFRKSKLNQCIKDDNSNDMETKALNCKKIQ